MRRFQYSQRLAFRPGRATTLATVVLLPLLVILGAWQLQRAAQKEALLDQWSTQAALPALQVGPDELPVLRGGGATGRHLVVHGQWDSRWQILLDNQVFHGAVGYRLFTPLRIADHRAVLVDRGWLPGGPRRELAPAVLPVSGSASLDGIAAPPPSPGPLARQVIDDSLGDGLLRVQRLDVGILSNELGMDFEPWTLRLDAAAPDGYRREAVATPRLAPERHRAYALQWFLFAVLLVGLYVGLNLHRR